MKYLGLNLDDRLIGEAVVINIVQKVNARLKFIRTVGFWKKSLGSQYVQHLFNATWIMLVHSILA